MRKTLFCLFLILVVMTIVACNNNTNSINSSTSTSSSIAAATENSSTASANSSSSTNSNSSSSSSTTNSSSNSISQSSYASSSSQEQQQPQNTEQEKFVQLVDKFVLVENNTLKRDYLVLPRVTDEYYGFITWHTSDTSVISADGYVYQKDYDQTVTLTAAFKLGDFTRTRSFNVTVKAKEINRYPIISENDDRILNKVYVKNPNELTNACNNAKAGDAIILESGTFSNVVVNLKKSGTESNPIFIFANNPDASKIKGVSTIEVTGSNVIVANLIFTEGRPAAERGCVIFNGNNLRLTNVHVKNYENSSYAFKWVSLTGKYHEIDNNTFDGKSTVGALLTIWRDDKSPQYHYIHNNQFKNYTKGAEANGYETIRVGDSEFSQSDSYVLIENNYFENVSGEVEFISIKAGRTYVRGNTIVSSVGLLTARHGKNSVIENNVFFCNKVKDAGGIRAYDGGHLIRNNYVEGVDTGSNNRGGIVIHSGDNQPGTSYTLNGQWTAFNVLVTGNTIYNSRQSILYCGKFSVPSKDITVQNNIIVATSKQAATRYDKIPANLTYVDNYIFSDIGFSGGGSASVSVPSSGVTFSSALITLQPNSGGLRLHAAYGAQNLSVMTTGNTGVYSLR